MPTIHLAVVQIEPRKGAYDANLARLGDVFRQLDSLEPRPHLVHFAETILTGYFIEGGVRDLAVTAGRLAADLNRVFRDGNGKPARAPMDAVVGFYEVFENKLFNSALYVTLGGEAPVIRHVHRKVFLPTYGLFDEERFVERGHEIRAFDSAHGRLAMLVCEDAWHSFAGTLAALDGAQVVLILAAAPGRGVWPREDCTPGPASLYRWERLARDISEEHGVFTSVAHMLGNEGGKTFVGGSIVTGPKGDVMARAPLWEEAIVRVSLDTGDLTRARADMPLLTDLETMLPHLLSGLERVQRGEPVQLAYDPPERGATAPGEGHAAPLVEPEKAGEAATASERASRGSGRPRARGAPPKAQSRDGAISPRHRNISVITPSPRDQGGPPPLELDGELAERWLVHFLRDELARRGFGKAVVGISGGVDSAVTAYLAARALGADNVIGVRLPYRTSSAESLEHAALVIDALGLDGRTIDISPAVDGYLSHEPDADPTRRGNIMARMRMIALFDLSAKHRALPLGTGNKTERLFGYFTWHADDSPPVNPLGDMFKTQVWALARYLGVPDVIVDKPASADLVRGQTDEADFGISYAKADEILNWLLSGYPPAALVERGFDEAEVEVVRKRLAGTHWKRRLPTVAMISPNAIGESYLRPVDY